MTLYLIREFSNRITVRIELVDHLCRSSFSKMFLLLLTICWPKLARSSFDDQWRSTWGASTVFRIMLACFQRQLIGAHGMVLMILTIRGTWLPSNRKIKSLLRLFKLCSAVAVAIIQLIKHSLHFCWQPKPASIQRISNGRALCKMAITNNNWKILPTFSKEMMMTMTFIQFQIRIIHCHAAGLKSIAVWLNIKLCRIITINSRLTIFPSVYISFEMVRLGIRIRMRWMSGSGSESRKSTLVCVCVFFL